MDSNIIDIYYQRRKDNVIEYTKILMKNALDRKYMNIKSFQKIIEKYMDDDSKSNMKMTYKVNKFLNENSIVDLKLKRIINYTINFIDDNNVINDIYINKDYIILISKMILFSLQINTKTNILLNPKVRYKNIVVSILEDNTYIFNSKIKDEIISVQSELNEKIKANILDDKKFFKIIYNDKFNLKFTEISPDFYNVILNYDIKTLKKYLPTDVEEQIKTKKLNFDFTIITAELLSVYILKLLLVGKRKAKFSIKLEEDFINNIEFLDELTTNLSNPKVKTRVCLNIDYKSFLKNKAEIEYLKSSGFKIAIYDMNKLNHNAYLFKNTVDYIFLNNKLKDNSNDVFDFCNSNNLTLFDDTLDTKKYIKEDYLLKH